MHNWTTPGSPRFARASSSPADRPGPVLRVATFNLYYAARLSEAAAVIRSTPALAEADLLALQEADEEAAERLADLLEAGFVYYPAVRLPQTGRNFGPALISRWPILSDRKLILPHTGLHGMQRVAVGATLQIRGQVIEAWGVHFGTMREILPAQQAAQARAVLAAAAPAGAAVIAGDLNRKGVGRVFEAAGWHWPTRQVGRTHHVWSFDHVFTRGFDSGRAAVGSVRAALNASDHRAVWAHLSLPAPANGQG